MNIIILGGGISAISLAYFLQNKNEIKSITILEKENKFGGLLRSYNFDGIYYDVGPHIIFSKHEEILELNKKVLGANINKFKRSNKIMFKNKFVRYPFENDLSKLNSEDRNIALNSFLNNPYKNYKVENMRQFFLSVFGQGITDLYLAPYNKKIWKYDLSFLDTQMVERIPRPPDKDISDSAKGKFREGYRHQLNFSYPRKGGIESLFKSYLSLLNKKKVFLNKNFIIKSIKKEKLFNVTSTAGKKISGDIVISTIPLCELNNYISVPKKIDQISKNLKFNSIIISMVKVKGNFAGNNFAIMVPDEGIIFHRISKLNFFGKNYSKKNYTYFQIEITYRKNDNIDKLSVRKLKEKMIEGLFSLKFANKKTDIKKISLKKFKYAYVIYDLNHRKNVDSLKEFYENKNIFLNGRWGSWEYLNSDQVIFQSKNLSERIKKMKIKL